MEITSTNLEREAAEIAMLISGRRVSVVRRHRIGEIMIEFDDGTRLFINSTPDDLDFSITDGNASEAAES